ncbi:MAG: polysaccharide deacetylase family protein [Proteobacteria bacterium]|nr:polysaccharide deacetylase family protein [Pseudomonadota bacterium]
MSSWAAIDEELARWRDAGRTPTLWWRDDDAVDATPALERLLALQRTHGVPLALAVVPAGATPALAARLSQAPGIDLLQHGYAHTNHAPAGEKKAELGPERPAMLVLGELGTGWLALERLFGPSALPVLVPPWNRIAPGLVPALLEIGFRGLSTFGIRPRSRVVSGWVQVNTHIDLIDWRTRRFAGTESVLGDFARALASARTEADEPLGLLSHHLAMDEAAWDFLNSFWEKVGGMPGLEIAAANSLFAAREAQA